MKRAQQGFGLVEMLISLTIGLVLLLGLSTILISMTRTAELRGKMAELQGAQRMALSLAGNALRYAGAFPYSPLDTPATRFPAASPFGAGQSLVGTEGGTNSDTVSVRFVASATTTSSQGCSAKLVPGHSYTDVFSIVNGYLHCDETDTTDSKTIKVDLIAGLTKMDIMYGVDKPKAGADETKSGSVTQYLSATDVASPKDYWDDVKTVKLTLTFTNPLANDPGNQQPPTVSITQTIPHAIGL
ncbi:PilW family protein [Massilia sp. TWP1-3-3]|uniref:PilW family protein n=1 Tax=Massilia sp. TWP1-3-3 TaxID=2804573 RepID=UPI003CE74024